MQIVKKLKTMNNKPKRHLRFLSRGHDKQKVQMTFLVTVQIKNKNTDMSLTSCPYNARDFRISQLNWIYLLIFTIYATEIFWKFEISQEIVSIFNSQVKQLNTELKHQREAWI